MADNLGFIRGLTFHSRDSLATRFGFTSNADLLAIADILCGEEGKDWERTDVGPQHTFPPAHGRRFTYRGQELIAVTIEGSDGTPVAKTFLPVALGTDATEDEDGSMNARELQAQNKALHERIARLEIELKDAAVHVGEVDGENRLLIKRCESLTEDNKELEAQNSRFAYEITRNEDVINGIKALAKFFLEASK